MSDIPSSALLTVKLCTSLKPRFPARRQEATIYKLSPMMTLRTWVVVTLSLRSRSLHKITHSTSVDRFTELATIDWRVIKSSKLTYHGVEMPVATKGSLHGGNIVRFFVHNRRTNSWPGFNQATHFHRTWWWTIVQMDVRILRVTVSFDDKQWVLGAVDGLSHPKLVLNDGSNMVVARGHRSKLDCLGKPRQARLEIFPNLSISWIHPGYLRLDGEIRKDGEKNRRGLKGKLNGLDTRYLWSHSSLKLSGSNSRLSFTIDIAMPGYGRGPSGPWKVFISEEVHSITAGFKLVVLRPPSNIYLSGNRREQSSSTHFQSCGEPLLCESE